MVGGKSQLSEILKALTPGFLKLSILPRGFGQVYLPGIPVPNHSVILLRLARTLRQVGIASHLDILALVVHIGYQFT